MLTYKGTSFPSTEMIYIVHGNDYSRSRELILNQQKNTTSQNNFEFDATEIQPKKLYEITNSVDLFGNFPFVVISIPSQKFSDSEEYLKVIKATPKNTVLIILCDKKLPATNIFIKAAKEMGAKIAVNEIKHQGNIFNFVDNLFYKNKKSAYAELNNLLEEGTDEFYLFSMILYGLRTVTLAKFPTPEFKNKSTFVVNKALKQAENFSEEEIEILYNIAYETDKKMKTGQMQPEIAIVYLVEKIIA